MTLPANPNGYTITIKDANGNIIPAANYGSLAPGSYTITYSKDGYISQTSTFNVTAGQATVLPAAPTLVMAASSGSYYVDANGNMVAIPAADLNNAGTKFVFYAWLQDASGAGVTPANLATGAAPTAAEQAEVAPLNTQNIAGAYIGYKAADGKTYPVVGANVRWDITQQTGSTLFSAADDGGQPSGAPISKADINDMGMSANTYTNSATGTNVRFPSSSTYPTYNMTGVGTPDTSGFTWTALNHDPKATTATARIRVIGYVNGTEISKQWLDKTFAPSAQLAITKGPKTQTVNVGDNATFNVTVTNTGAAPATGVKLSDVLSSGTAANYSIVSVAGGGSTVSGTGFNSTFDIPAGGTVTITLVAKASAVGQYCDTVTINSYNNGAFGAVTPSGLSDSACMTVIAPTLNIIKTLVDANGAAISSPQSVAKNTPVFAKITVSNSGNAAANNVVVTEAFQGPGAAANYSMGTITSAPTVATTKNAAGNGFTSAAFNLAAGASQTFTFPAQASADGTYCDNASASATNTSGTATTVAGSPTANVCFTVTSPALAITKVNQTASGGTVPNLYPGSSYQSVISVTNSGTGAATGVAVNDVLGNLTNTYMNFGSGTYVIKNADGSTSSSGSLALTTPTSAPSATNPVITVPSAVTLNAGQTITLTLTSTVPAGAPAGQYCDVATFTSTNAGTNTARACVTVVNFVSTRTQMSDGDNTDPSGTNKDPVPADGKTIVTLASGVSVENSSNQGVKNNSIVFNFGSTDPRGATPGVFQVQTTSVYYDPTPAINQKDGSIVSDYTNASSKLLTLGTDYTLTPGGNVPAGQSQTINILATSPLVANGTIVPGGVIWTRHLMVAPVGTAPRTYNSSLLWSGNGANDNAATGGASSEPTTTLTPN